jgi:hypothetical protein
MKFNISQSWLEKHLSDEDGCESISAGRPPRLKPYYHKVGDWKEWGDYFRRIKEPNWWAPVTSFGQVTEDDLKEFIFVAPHDDWRHTDEFEKIAPEWLRKLKESNSSGDISNMENEGGAIRIIEQTTKEDGV